MLHVLRNVGPIEVYLFQAPSWSESGLWTYGAYASDSWRVNRRFTLNVGLRFDRHRVFLPEQTHPIGRFNSEPQTFAAVADVIDWNMVVPRISLIHDLTGSGKSVVKLSYGHYSISSGNGRWFQCQPECECVVAALHVVRRQRERCLGTRRGGSAAGQPRRDCARVN